MKAFQCSRCCNLYDVGENCVCSAHIDPRPNHRCDGDSEICKKNFKPLEEDKLWHVKFHWE